MKAILTLQKLSLCVCLSSFFVLNTLSLSYLHMTHPRTALIEAGHVGPFTQGGEIAIDAVSHAQRLPYGQRNVLHEFMFLLSHCYDPGGFLIINSNLFMTSRVVRVIIVDGVKTPTKLMRTRVNLFLNDFLP